MPYRPKTPCNHFQCPKLITPGDRYCDEHTWEKQRKYNRNHKAARAKRDDHKENAFYGSVRWKRLRAMKLAEAPLCERCEEQGRVVQAAVVHHTTPVKADGDYLPTLAMLESLCKSCHSKEHYSDTLRRGRG